jgi:hypothetical protein
LSNLKRRGVEHYHVEPQKNGWTSLFEQQASDQDDRWIRELASGLSADLGVPAIAFLVHDSDIACYWLFQDGSLLDEYNSHPDYFDDRPGDSGPSGGDADVLLPFCHRGVGRDDLVSILNQNSIFAENIVEGIAGALGIDPDRALSDYRDVTGGGGPGGFGGSDDDDDGGSDPDGGVIPFQLGSLSNRMATLIGHNQHRIAPADPQALALVQAAIDDDTAEVDRLIAAGVPADAEAPAPLPEGQAIAGLQQVLPGGALEFAMTPLLAAVIHKRRRSAERLLRGGADPNRVHPLFGTPLHAAAAAGEPDLLHLLIEHQGNVAARNAQGQTPLEVIAACRSAVDRLAHVESMMQSMGLKLPNILDQLKNTTPPSAGWAACERLLGH